MKVAAWLLPREGSRGQKTMTWDALGMDGGLGWEDISISAMRRAAGKRTFPCRAGAAELVMNLFHPARLTPEELAVGRGARALL